MGQRTDQEEIRIKRRSEMIAAGVDVYPARCSKAVSVADVKTDWVDGRTVAVVGRVRAVRLQGGSAFLNVEDGTGEQKDGTHTIQVFLQKKNLANDFENVVENLDLGDFIYIKGNCFITKRGEKTIDAVKIDWLAKSLRPLPSNWYGLEDVELRFRHRELDLITDENCRKLFIDRAAIIQSLRGVLVKEKFIEVETPILQTIAGGATARPFITHHQALDIDLYLRIAPELYLKRLIVGGLNRVYEVARCFRNEGMDRDHNPEFTQIELYAAYQDYTWMMKFTEKLIKAAAVVVNGKTVFTYDKKEINCEPPFKRITYREAILNAAGVDIEDRPAVEKLVTEKKMIDGSISKVGYGKMVDEVFKTFVRPNMIEPTIVYDYPLELSPLAKKKTSNPNYTERFQLLMGGTEIGNAFSELNDPIDQRERFVAQEKLRQSGDDEAQRIDEDYIQAMEYGMPPTAGLGIGIDRLTAVLTNQASVKNVILFPTLKPKI